MNHVGGLKPSTSLTAGVIAALPREMAINVNGLIAMAQAFAPVLKANDGGIFGPLNSIVSLKFTLLSAPHSRLSPWSSFGVARSRHDSFPENLRARKRPLYRANFLTLSKSNPTSMMDESSNRKCDFC